MNKATKLWNKNFFLLWQGQLVSQIGTQGYLIAMMFWIKHATGSAALVGTITMLSTLPMVIFGPIAGTFADRNSRKWIIVLSDAFRGIAVLALAGVILFAPDETELIIISMFAASFAVSSISAFFNPAINASIPDIVPEKNVEAANSLTQSIVRISMFVGCGLAGGLFYLFLVAVRFLPPGEMVGASGAILGLLAACAILFPQFIVIIFIFPVPIRFAAIGLTAVYFLILITRGGNAGGHAAHLAGMAAGAAYVYSQSWRHKYTSKLHTRQWEKHVTAQRDLQAEVDRILQKVHESGIQSLTRKEKNILKEATKAEQRRNQI